MSATRRLTTISFLSAVGIALFVLESYIPMPVPFLKVGLANISSVIALMILGAPGMLTVVVLRVVVGSLFVGTFLSPGFVLAFCAGVGSALAMAATKAISNTLFSAVGISLIGSVLHVVIQLLIVRYFYVQNAAILSLLPLLMLTALVSGLIVGLLSARLLASLRTIRL